LTTPGSVASIPVDTVNNTEWCEGDVFLETNRPFTQKTWKFIDQHDGREYTQGCDVNKEWTPYDYFMAVFPKSQLSQMYALTNEKIWQHNDSITELSGTKKEALTMPSEILRWFGVCILMTTYEFGDEHPFGASCHLPSTFRLQTLVPRQGWPMIDLIS
jgi:hypothetical protein